MRFYARPSLRLVGQIVADVFVVVWASVWWNLGRRADALVRSLSHPSDQAATTASDLQKQLGDAASQIGQVPMLGDRLRGPFEQMQSTVGSFGDASHAQSAAIAQTATMIGWAVFLIPLALVVIAWLPARLRFARRAGITKTLVNTPGGDELLALRALATRPIGELLKADPDPVGAWRAADPDALRRLADVELRATGVSR